MFTLTTKLFNETKNNKQVIVDSTRKGWTVYVKSGNSVVYKSEQKTINLANELSERIFNAL